MLHLTKRKYVQRRRNRILLSGFTQLKRAQRMTDGFDRFKPVDPRGRDAVHSKFNPRLAFVQSGGLIP